MEKKNSFMQTKPVFSLLLSMSVPMMLSMLIQSLYNIVDSIYVSRLGTDALTAVSLAYPLQNAILSAAVGIGVGISSAISIHLGAGNREKADRAATLGIALTLIHCIFFIIAGLTISEPFLKLFTDNPKILNDASIYTEIVLCLSFGSLFQIAFEKIFQGIGVFAGKGCSGVVAQNDLWELILFGESENEGFHKNLSKLFFTISHGIGGKDGYKTMFFGIRGAGGNGRFSCWC